MKAIRIFLSLWVITIMLGQPVAHAQSTAIIPGSSPIATPTPEGLSLEWNISAPELTRNPAGEIEIKIQDFLNDNIQGAPALPFDSVLVALPSQGNPSLEIQSIVEHQVGLPGPLATVAFDSAATVPSNLKPFIPEKIQWVEIGTQRGVRLARLTIHPVLPQDNQLQVVSQVKVLIRFAVSTSQVLDLNDPILRTIQSQVVNPTQVESNLSSAIRAADVSAFSNSNAYAIEVDRPGIVQVSFTQLQAAGFPITTINPQNIHLTQGGQEVAYERVSTPASGEVIRFFAKPRFSRWMTNDVYLLMVGNTPGTSIQNRSTSPGAVNNGWADVLVEKNEIYTADCLDCAPIPLGRDGDRWVWSEFSQPGAPTASYSFSTLNVDTSASSSLTLWMIGKTDVPTSPDHQVNLNLNGTGLGSVTWNGKTAFSPTFTIPAGALHSGSNTLTLDVPVMSGVNIDSFWMDAFNIHYRLGSASNGNEIIFTGDVSSSQIVSYQQNFEPSTGITVYNITNPNLPVHLAASAQNSFSNVTFGDSASSLAQTYLVANEIGIHAPARIRALQPLATSNITSANYIIIAPDGYDAVLQPLIALRSKQDPQLPVVVEHLQAIYDQFSEGRLDPEAIRSYLKYAYTHWQNPRPAYVLLVGDGNIDPKKYRSTDFDTILPAMLKADVDPYTTDSSTDNRFVILSEDPKQVLPDMLIGRLPANSIAEAQVMVDKIVSYETNPVPGSWKSRTIFVADQYFDGGASRAAKLITPTIFNTPTQLYYLKNFNDAAAIHTAIVNYWNQGASLIMYTGHASVHFWSAASFFHISNDLDLLTNGGKLPVVLQMTCYTGTFQMGSISSMDEQLIRKANGGALAVWGSSSEGLSNGHEYLAQGFINNITKETDNNPTHNLGLATYAGRLNVAIKNPQNTYLIDSFILFGDPLSRVIIDLTPKQGVLLPLIKR